VHGATEWILGLQYGRINDARNVIEEKMIDLKKMVAFPCRAGFNLGVVIASVYLPQTYYMLGLPQYCQKMFDVLGFTFDNVEEALDKASKPAQGFFFSAREQKEPGGGFFSLTRIIWHVKALMILMNKDIPRSKAIAWLESLPDNDAVYAYSMTLPTHDGGGRHGVHRSCWIALAHEKVGLYDGALRFADLQLEPDLLKAGTPLTKWPQMIAFACKGRVLAKLDRPVTSMTDTLRIFDSRTLMRSRGLRNGCPKYHN